MFVAQLANRELVTLRTHEQATALPHQDYFCPNCGGALIVKNGQVLPAHFAHRGHACQPSEPESAVHMRGKLWLANLGERLGYTVSLERYFSGIRQRADVVWEKAGDTLVVEFQCSPLSGERLAARTAGYRSLGLRCVWVLGQPYLHGPSRSAKFLQYSATLAWHWWGFDGQQLVAHSFRPGHASLLGDTTTRHWERSVAAHRSPVAAAQRVARQLHYRDGVVMALQAQAYAARHNLVGVPWVVHQALTGLPGLLQPEWALRTAWLLAFEGADVDATADSAWWTARAALQAKVTPLLGEHDPLTAVSRRWLALLEKTGHLEKTATGCRWREALIWYAALEQKLAANYDSAQSGLTKI